MREVRVGGWASRGERASKSRQRKTRWARAAAQRSGRAGSRRTLMSGSKRNALSSRNMKSMMMRMAKTPASVACGARADKTVTNGTAGAQCGACTPVSLRRSGAHRRRQRSGTRLWRHRCGGGAVAPRSGETARARHAKGCGGGVPRYRTHAARTRMVAHALNGAAAAPRLAVRSE